MGQKYSRSPQSPPLPIAPDTWDRMSVAIYCCTVVIVPTVLIGNSAVFKGKHLSSCKPLKPVSRVLKPLFLSILFSFIVAFGGEDLLTFSLGCSQKSLIFCFCLDFEDKNEDILVFACIWYFRLNARCCVWRIVEIIWSLEWLYLFSERIYCCFSDS